MNAIDLSIPLVREAALLAGIVVLFLLMGIIAFAVRTASLPACGQCGFHSVRRSHSHDRISDNLARLCLLVPYRCEKCRRRFYCFPSGRVARHSGSRSMAASKDHISVTARV